VGVLSLSVMVTVASESVRTAAPVTLDKLTVKLSLPSKMESSVIGIVNDCVDGVRVLPVAANVSVVLETPV
jgi:anti-sigma factor ChrR (cupin superfamily)